MLREREEGSLSLVTKYIYAQSTTVSVYSLELGLSHPLTPASVFPPPFVRGGGTHSLARKGVGGPYSDEEKETVVL
jgi:hypothetical protein